MTPRKRFPGMSADSKIARGAWPLGKPDNLISEVQGKIKESRLDNRNLEETMTKILADYRKGDLRSEMSFSEFLDANHLL